MFSEARVGEPAATKPITGTLFSFCLSDCEFSNILMPRDEPALISMYFFFSRALRCVSAELGELKPSSLQISALVGGNPVLFMLSLIQLSTFVCCGVNFLITIYYIFIQYINIFRICKN